MMRIVVIIVVILIILGGLSAFLGPVAYKKIQSRLENQQQTIVRTEKPVRGELIELIQAPGEIEPKTNVELSARISSRITELPFIEGDEVKAGDILIKLDATDLEAALQASEARRAADEARLEVQKVRITSQKSSIEGTRSSLRQATEDLERKKELFNTGDVSQVTLDELQSRVEELQASLSAAEQSIQADELNLIVMQHNLEVADAEITQARDRLAYTVITSPINGVVTKLNAEVGELVMTGTMNNAGTVIMEVANLDTMLLVAQVDEADVGGLKVGQPCVVRINAYQDEEFTGIVETIALTHQRAQDGSKFFKTEIVLDTQGRRIYSGLTADVDIEARRNVDILKVPSQSILECSVDSLPLAIRDNNPDVDMTKTFATVVYVYEDGKAMVRPVTIGASDLTHTVVLSGVTEEDSIVVGPYKVLESLQNEQVIKDEQEVKAEEEQKKRDMEQKKKDNEAIATTNDDKETKSQKNDNGSSADESEAAGGTDDDNGGAAADTSKSNNGNDN